VNKTFGKIRDKLQVHAMMAYTGVEEQFQSFFTSAHTYVLNHVF